MVVLADQTCCIHECMVPSGCALPVLQEPNAPSQGRLTSDLLPISLECISLIFQASYPVVDSESKANVPCNAWPPGKAGGSTEEVPKMRAFCAGCCDPQAIGKEGMYGSLQVVSCMRPASHQSE